MKKQNVLLFAAFLLLAAAFAPTAWAYDFYSVASNGDTLYYNIFYGNEAEVEVVAPRNDSWDGYTQPSGNLTIPDSVTYGDTTYSVISIGPYAFCNCTGLTSVTIGNSVNSICAHAFEGCSSLTSVTIPNSVTGIGGYAFCNCTGLTSLTIPNSVTNICEYAFAGCSGLTSVTIPNSVTTLYAPVFYICSGLTTVNFNADSCTTENYVGNCAVFYDCANLTTLNIGSNVKKIPEYFIRSCPGLTSVTIPNSVTCIGDYAFESFGDLTSVTIGNSVTSIGHHAFHECSNLTSITIPNSVTTIGRNAFSHCTGLTSVTIPDSVTSIGTDAFGDCSGLTTVNFNAINCTTMGTAGAPVFGGGTNFTTLNIGNNVTNIPNYAFSGCRGLTSVTIPNSVTTIGGHVFFECSNLLNIVCKSVYPPAAQGNSFDGIWTYCTLTVPCGSLPYYSVTEPWNTKFQIMNEDCRPEYTVTVVSADPTMGTVSGGGQVLEGDEVTLTAIANEGYHFLHWNDGDTNTTRTVVVTSDTTFTAYFEADGGTEGIDDVDGMAAKVYSANGQIVVENTDGHAVTLYDAVGRTLAVKHAAPQTIRFDVPATGTYLVKVGNAPACRIVVVK